MSSYQNDPPRPAPKRRPSPDLQGDPCSDAQTVRDDHVAGPGRQFTVRFVAEDCTVVGQLDTEAADEAGELPAGTRYVVVSDRLGIGTRITLQIG